jgi:hypothetical protein
MDRQHAHELLDQLDPGQLDAVVRLLEVMTSPEGTSIRNAPLDDEPMTDDEERAVTASKEWFRKNKGIPFEDVVAELGFSMEEIRGEKGSA